jgi:hypothetical protein
MPVDASIALGVKPMPIESPINQMAKMYEMQNAVQSNQLNQMKMDEYKRGLTEDEAIKNALTRLDRNSPTYEQDRFNAYALKGIEGVKAYAATKNEEAAAEEHAVGTTGKKLTNVKEASAFHRDNLWGVTDSLSAAAWVENLYKDATIGSSLDTMIPKQQMLASIPTDPTQLANWKTQVAMGSKEFAKESMAKPSDLARLQNEMNALLPNDPRRVEYKNAINKLTTHAPAASSTVNMPPQEKEFEKELGKEQAKTVLANKTNAENAAKMLATNKIATNLLNEGMLTGTGAEFFTQLNQGLKLAGLDFGYGDAAKNSQAYGALMAKNTASIIKDFGAGTGLSDADREYALSAAGGKINMDEKALRRIIDINSQAAQNVITKHNKDVSSIKTNVPLTVNVGDYTAGITEPTATDGRKPLTSIIKTPRR